VTYVESLRRRDADNGVRDATPKNKPTERIADVIPEQ